MSHPLYIVDGSGYIFRAYYGVAPLSNSKGFPTNALLGFSRMLLKLIKDVDARYLTVAFDTGKPTFRHEMYSEYKANRGDCPEDLVPQMPYFRKIVEAFGLRSLEMPGFEADDVIATIADNFANKKCDSEVDKVVIVSGDKDLTQLVNENITVWDAMRDVYFTPKTVKEKFGVSPEQIVDYLALVGDSSDNVPGIAGVGPKSAQKLIEHFGSIDRLVENLEAIDAIDGLRGKKSLIEKIKHGQEKLALSRELVSLRYDVAPFDNISKSDEFFWDSYNDSLLEPLFLELEFDSLLKTLLGVERQKNLEKFRNYVLVNKKNFSELLLKLEQAQSFSFDVETTSLNPRTCELVGISFAVSENEAFYIPIMSNNGTDEDLFDLEFLRNNLNPIFTSDKLKIAHNVKFDLAVLKHQGFKVLNPFFDTMLASYVLRPEGRKHGLKSLSSEILGINMTTYDEMLGGEKDILNVSLENLAQYAAADSDLTLQLYRYFDVELAKFSKEEHGPAKVFLEIEMPLVEVLCEMEDVGVELDLNFLQQLSNKFEVDLENLQGSIYAFAGEEFNINSPKQLAEILFEKLQIPTKGLKKTKSGFSTDASVLSQLVSLHPIAEKLLEYRELFKLKSTYVDVLLDIAVNDNARVHTSYNQTIAATGRLTSSDPNLQNIPIKTERGRQLRKAFIAKPGFSLISADYSQIELRVLAHLSGDKALQAAFKQGEDIHLATAKDLFGAMIFDEDERKKLRRMAKTINFGVVYGISAFRLAGDLGISRTEAQKYIDNYFAKYPKVLEYFDTLKLAAKDLGYVSTLFGRRRYLADIDSSGRDKGYQERSMLNAPVQGTAADIIKFAMNRLFARLMDYGDSAKMIMQVHDELVFEVKDELVDEVMAVVVSEMEKAVDFNVPLKVDIRASKNWGE